MAWDVCFDCGFVYRMRFPGEAPPDEAVLEKMRGMGCPVCRL